MSVSVQIESLRKSLPEGVKLLAVSKYHPIELIGEAALAGQLAFGENHVQELVSKHQLRPDLEWHMIGHLQTNKVKYIIPFVSMIHSVDSLKLLMEIDRQASRCGRVVDCLLEVHVACEDTKYGLSYEQCRDLLLSDEYSAMGNVRLCGVMGMATNTDDTDRVRSDFARLRDIFNRLRSEFFADKPWFREISAGMSSDYQLAIEEGSTIVRIGSTIFGARNYNR